MKFDEIEERKRKKHSHQKTSFRAVCVYLPSAAGVAVGCGSDELLDLVLRLGHVWDRATAMETVANCRVSYASCCALLLAGVYAVWGDTRVAPSASGDDG